MKKTAPGRVPVARVLVIMAAVLAAGCATTKPAVPGALKPDAAEAGRAALQDAVRLMESGTAASLQKAAGILSSNGLPDTPQGAGAAAFGGRLFGLLYPDLENPFPKGAEDASALASAPQGSEFFARLAPALTLLSPAATDSAAAAAATSATAATTAPDDDILDSISRADTLRPDSVLPPYLRALLLERQDRPPEAIRPVFEECLRRDPGFYPGKLGILRTSITQEHADADLSLLAKYAAELPTPTLTYTALAQANLAAGKPRQAADAAARALLMSPESTQLVVLRARAFQALGDWYQALSVLDSLLRVRPDESDASALKARILFEKAGNPDGAMQVASEAEARFPQDPVFPELRGRIFLARGNITQGEAALQRALELDPARASTLTLLAGSAAAAQRWQEASAYLEKIPAWKRSPDVLRLAWQVAMSLGDNEQALSIAAALGKKETGDEPVILSLKAMLASGKIQETLDLAAKTLPTAGSPATRATLYMIRAQAQRRTGGNDSALADLRLALRENPDDLESLVAITDLLADSREYRRALMYLRHAEELAPSDAGLRARVAELAKLSESED